MRWHWKLVLLAAGTASPLWAQAPDSTSAPRYPTGELIPLAGVHFTGATGFTAHGALMLTDVSGIHGYGGWVVGAEAGQHGWKVGAGRGGGPPGMWSGLLRLSYLRSWGEEGPLAAGQDYLGADLRVGLFGVSVGASEHIRIQGDAEGDGSIFSLSLGLGF